MLALQNEVDLKGKDCQSYLQSFVILVFGCLHFRFLFVHILNCTAALTMTNNLSLLFTELVKDIGLQF